MPRQEIAEMSSKVDKDPLVVIRDSSLRINNESFRVDYRIYGNRLQDHLTDPI